MEPEVFDFLRDMGPTIALIAIPGVIGWVIVTWMRIKHGYPLDGAWGRAVYPKSADESDRVKSLSAENAQLRSEIAAIKGRLATVEKIVTDDSHRLSHEIEQLR